MAERVQWFSQSDYIILHYCTSTILLKPDRNTELARAVDVMMARAKRIYILIIKVNSLFSLLSSRSRCFLKEIENMSSVFLLSYRSRNIRESLGELEKAKETLACGSFSHNISRSPKLPPVFLFNN